MCKCCQLGNVANVQVLPASSVASFQLSEGCRGARAGRSGRFPEVRRVGVRGASATVANVGLVMGVDLVKAAAGFEFTAV